MCPPGQIRRGLAVMLAALWWGSLTTLGFLVVPMLFAYLPTPAMAGSMAAKLFGLQTWVSVGCGLMMLIASASNSSKPGLHRSFFAVVLIVSSMLMALLVEFGVAPRIVARENLRLWHGLGSALYFLQWFSVGVLLWQLGRRPTPS